MPAEFGLALFLLGAGAQAGAGFVEILQEHGVLLFVYGALMTLIPMLLGYVFAAKVLKLSIFNTLGSICGSMTSTPALGTLIRVTETDDIGVRLCGKRIRGAGYGGAGMPVYRYLLHRV